MNIWERFQHIDVRIIYLVLVVSVALPLLFPLNFPIEVSKETQGAYDVVDTLEPGDIIIMDSAYNPGSGPELYPSAVAIARHAFSKDVRIIGFNSWELGAQMMQRALDAAAADYGKEYGVDYIVLGYKRPLAATIRAAINDAHGAWKADINGTTLNNLPMMADFRSIKEDCHMIVVMNSGSPGAGNWVSYVGTPSQSPGPNNPDGFVRTVPIVVACVSVEISGSMASLQSGVYSGLVPGGRGGAEYELLINHPATGVGAMDAQSTGHLAIILFIILGNVGYLASRRSA